METTTTTNDERDVGAKRQKTTTIEHQEPPPPPPSSSSSSPSHRSSFIGQSLWTQVFGKDQVDLHVRSTTSDDDVEVGVYASRDYQPNELMGGPHCRGLHWKDVLDPVEVVEHHPLATHIRFHSSSCQDDDDVVSDDILFWMCLASMALESDHLALTLTSPHHTPNPPKSNLHRHSTYLQSLPRVSPDPCSWKATTRQSYLQHTHLGIQVEKQYELLHQTYEKIVSKVDDDDHHHPHHVVPFPPFDVDGQGKFGSFLWARGVHLSRSFPQQLLLAAKMKTREESGVILRTELGGTLPPRISFRGGDDDNDDDGNKRGNHTDLPSTTSATTTTTCPSTKNSTIPPPTTTTSAVGKSDSTTTTTTTTTTTSIATNRLGVMLPFFDLCNHQSQLDIVWEAGNEYIRFRFGNSKKEGTLPKKGQPICNNYGPKGNQELLFTYGFALPNNPFDSVEGIVFGCPCDPESPLGNARLRILQDSNVPYQLKNDNVDDHNNNNSNNRTVLMMGPFALCRQPEQITMKEDSTTTTTTTTTNLSDHHVVPDELYHGLSVLGMENANDEPAITPEDIDALVEQFHHRINKLQGKMMMMMEEEKDCKDNDGGGGGGGGVVWKEEFCKRYRQGEILLLRMAIDEVQSLLQEE